MSLAFLLGFQGRLSGARVGFVDAGYLWCRMESHEENVDQMGILIYTFVPKVE